MLVAEQRWECGEYPIQAYEVVYAGRKVWVRLVRPRPLSWARRVKSRVKGTRVDV